jgi:hypothetical protein
MFSKLSIISLAAVLALSAAASGVARANPIPTSTDEARALAGQVTAQLHIDATDPENGAVTTTDQARAEAGRSQPDSSGAWVAPMLAKDEGEGRAASVGDPQASSERETLAASPAATNSADWSN